MLGIRMMLRVSVVALVLVACGGDDRTSLVDGGGGADGGATDAPAVGTAMLQARVQNLDDSSVEGALATFVERPDITATTDASGTFTMEVPTETELTLVVTAEGQVPTVSQPVIFHGDLLGSTFTMARTDQFAHIDSFGSRPPDAGNFLVGVIAGSCDVTGAHLGTSPSSGTVAYARRDRLPSSTLTSLESGTFGGYFIGVSGTVVPEITDVPAPCGQRPFPAEFDTITVLGPVTVMPGALHDVSIFVE